jgi:type I restriction enzyme S subunit
MVSGVVVEQSTDGPMQVPEGWLIVRLADVVKRLTDGTHQPPTFTASGIPFVIIGNISGDRIDWTSIKKWVSAATYADESKRLSPLRDDILYTAVGSYGLAVRVLDDREFMFQRHIAFLRPDKRVIDPTYLCHALNSPSLKRQADRVARGVAQKTVTLGSLREFDIPLAPLAEQRRIVARVDELFAEIAEGEAALAAARKDLDTFRRALLKAAVTGELTKDWRAANAVCETGHDMARAINDRTEKGATAKRRRVSDGRSIDLSALPGLPKTWTWASLGALIASGPTNGYSPKRSADGLGTVALKLTATTKGIIDLSERAVKILSETIPVGSDLFLEPGDLLFQRGNTIEYVGIAAVYDGPTNKYVYPDLMIRVRTANPAITEWIWRVANSPFGRQYMSSNATGTAGTMPKISGEILRNLPVPIPPLAELHEILRRTSEALAGTTDALAMLEGEIADSTRLKQSVLKAAFEGRLVPQDSTDAPASTLLAGIASNLVATKRGRVRKFSS